MNTLLCPEQYRDICLSGILGLHIAYYGYTVVTVIENDVNYINFIINLNYLLLFNGCDVNDILWFTYQ